MIITKRQKLNTAGKDVKASQVLSRKVVVKETSKWFNEDLGLTKLAKSREKTFDRKKALKHHDVW